MKLSQIVDIKCLKCKSDKLKVFVNEYDGLEISCYDCGEYLMELNLDEEKLLEVVGGQVEDITKIQK